MNWIDAFARNHLLQGSIVAGVAAALCGIVSLSFFPLEAAFWIDAQDVAEWRPLFMVWAGSFLLIGWLASHRAARISTPEESKVATSRIPKWNRAVLWTATTVVAFSVTFPSVWPAIVTALEPHWPSAVSSNAIAVRISVPSIDCAHCARGLDAALRKQEGLEKAEISWEKREAIVWYNPAKTSKTTVLDALRSNHYEVEELK